MVFIKYSQFKPFQHINPNIDPIRSISDL